MKDLTGMQFYRLKVIERTSNSKSGKARWVCKCDCGKETVVVGSKLINGKTKSCGCLALESRIKHGLRHHALYKVWQGMKQRCLNSKASRYECYGGRGIKVCNEWNVNFESFYNDMIGGYEKGLQLDRIDNEKGYCKENCRWVTSAKNVRNRNCTVYYQGECLKDYCKEHNLNYNTVIGRINQYKWPIEKALLAGSYRGKRGMKNVE